MTDDRRVDSEQDAPIFDIVSVGAGDRARSWLETVSRSPRLRLVGTVARSGDALVSGVPVYRCVGEAVDAHPAAGFALALPPRSGLAAALTLEEAGVAAVVEAPLHDSLCELDLAAGSELVRVAHGWTTLPGRRVLEKLVRRIGSGRVSVEIAGLPESEQGDLKDALVHGLALARSLVSGLSVRAARLRRGELAVELESAGTGWAVEMKLRARGSRLGVRVEGVAEAATWTWENGRETVALGGRALIAEREAPNGAARALAQLVTRSGDTLRDAAAVLRLRREVEGRLDFGLPPGGRELRQSASIAERRPADLLGRLGLRGELPTCDDPPAAVLDPTMPPEPFELWAFRAGLKPVVFLTVLPSEVERTLECFGDVHCERRERFVSVAAQDRWTDRRDRGDARVELYLSREPDLARRAAHLQSEVDPSEAIRELGELVGYPACCVEAFADQEDRANNSLNRYGSWGRTIASLDSGDRAWPWELNNLYAVVAPFYPCTYACERALAWARAALTQMALQYPAQVEELAGLLARPVLYFDHDHQLIFEGEVSAGEVSYRGVNTARGAPSEFRVLATVVARGDQLMFDDRELVVIRSGSLLLRFDRTDPALGFVAPFS